MKLMKSLVIIATIIAVAPLASVYAEDAFTISTDQIYGHKAGMALTFDVIRPTENANGVGLLYMVSGGWVSRYFDLERAMSDSGNQRGRFSSLVDRGYTLFMVRHGSSPYFKVPDAVKDVRRALRYIRYHAADFGVDPERLGVFGGSAGGHLSLMLGTTSDNGDSDSKDPISRTPARVAAVVAYFPPVDLRKSVGPSDRFPALDFDPDLAASISPILHVTADDPPTLLVHGDKDTLVPLSNSERIHAAFEAVNVVSHLIVLEGAGHGFRGEHGSQAAAALTDWFDRYLLRQSTE
ncbi:MAG: alpha/beta hydrolase [Candidatus Hydrogenedentes bacterium]|nr:alpha/beta hydrolase [Candidatus Hydrogenedentota bacterium]